MTSPKEIIAQLLSSAQAETLGTAGTSIWEAASVALQQLVGALPELNEAEGRLVMPDEILGEYEFPHLILPLALTTNQDQSATAYAIAATGETAAYFGVEDGSIEDQAAQASLVGSTIFGQVMSAIARQVFAGSATALKVTAGDIITDAMPMFLGAMDEPALVINAVLGGEKPLTFSLILPGTWLDIMAGALPPVTVAAPADGQSGPSASPFELTLDELDDAAFQEDAEPAAAPVFEAPPAYEAPPVYEPPPTYAAPPPVRAPLPFRPPAPPGPTASRVHFIPLPDPEPSHQRANMDLLAGLQMHVSVELGRTDLTVAEVLALGPGSVVELDRVAGEPVDILVNDRLIARGEVVVVDENFGVRVVEVIRRGAEHEERVS